MRLIRHLFKDRIPQLFWGLLVPLDHPAPGLLRPNPGTLCYIPGHRAKHPSTLKILP